MSNFFKIVLRIAGLIGVIVLAFYLAYLASENEVIQEMVASYGYTGIFFVAIISGFNLLVPIPAASLIPLFIESGFSFWPSILVISLGMTTADTIAFILARAGKLIVTESFGKRIFERFSSLREKYYRSPLVFLLFWAAFAPLPNEILLVPAAFLGYSFKHVIPVVFVGNFIFNILFAKGLLNFFQALY